MHGLGGYEGWRWIFIVEGIVSVVLGVTTWFALVDTPEHSGAWLSGDEIRYMEILDFVKEGGKLEKEACRRFKVETKALKYVMCQWRLWMFGMMDHAAGACAVGK